ncbi:MAG: hypothetical protein ACRCWM_08285 [Sarcina sp.]
MFAIFKDKQVQINLVDAGLFCIGIIMLFFSTDSHGARPELTNISVFAVLAIGLLFLAILNHFLHDLLGKRIFLYALNYIGLLILCYTSDFSLYGTILYIIFALLSDYSYKKFIDPK